MHIHAARDVVVRPPADDAEIRACSRVGTRAFRWDTKGWYRKDRSLAVFHRDGRMVACLAHGIGEAWWGARRVPLGFVGGVATDPEEQRRGYGAALMIAAVHRLRELGQVTSPLWPFSHRWYGRLGWALCSVDPVYKVAPAVLRTLPAPRCPVSLLPREAVPRLLPLFESFARRYNACTVRTSESFAHAVGKQRVVVCGRPPRGYAVFRVTDDRKGIMVEEFVAADADAEVSILRYFGSRRREWIRILAPADSTLLDLFPEPYRVDIEMHKRLSMRVLDAERALCALAPPAGVRGCLRFAVRDRVVNSRGPVRFTVRIEKGRIRREPRLPRTTPRVACDIRAFSQFFAGFRSATQLAARDRLTCDRPAGLNLLDRLLDGRLAFRSGLESG